MIVTVAEADAYFTTRLGASRVWTSGAAKEAALQTAENDLSLYFNLDSANALHKRAVFEQALFRLMDQDSDTRSALLVQGVISAGIIKEAYRNINTGPPVCGYARQILGEPNAAAFGGQITRDDDA